MIKQTTLNEILLEQDKKIDDLKRQLQRRIVDAEYWEKRAFVAENQLRESKAENERLQKDAAKEVYE